MNGKLKKRKLEKKCIELVGKGFFDHVKSSHITQYGQDMYEKALPDFLDMFSKQAEMVTNTKTNSKNIEDIKVMFSCLFARGKNAIDVKRAEDITMKVLKLLINESHTFAQMASLYMISAEKHDVGIYPKVFSISDASMKKVSEYHQAKELFAFVESKGYKVDIIDSARQIFPYTYFDEKTSQDIDCILYFHV